MEKLVTFVDPSTVKPMYYKSEYHTFMVMLCGFSFQRLNSPHCMRFCQVRSEHLFEHFKAFVL